MTIITDTREQAPWTFKSYNKILTLPTGDYSVEGFEFEICVERKSLNDLVNSIIHDWVRFSKVLRRMAAMNVACIVCEAPVTAVVEKAYESETLPQSVRGRLNAITIDYGVPCLFLDNRSIAAEWVENLFTQYARRQNTHVTQENAN